MFLHRLQDHQWGSRVVAVVSEWFSDGFANGSVSGEVDHCFYLIAAKDFFNQIPGHKPWSRNIVDGASLLTRI